jgi:hypothetical protein
MGAPKLVLTSPPYLGVHVLYHRWQIFGRRETAFPYWIAGKKDGHTGSFYTFADRRAFGVTAYMNKLRACFESLSKVVNARSYIAQLVAFSDADIQLPMYLKALEECGLELCESLCTDSASVGLQRAVPNRRWYAVVTNQSNSSKEFMLVHRRRKGGSR